MKQLNRDYRLADWSMSLRECDEKKKRVKRTHRIIVGLLIAAVSGLIVMCVTVSHDNHKLREQSGPAMEIIS